MPVTPPEQLEFHHDGPDQVLAAMRELAESRRGWINLQPRPVDEDDVPPAGGIFSNKGPALPLCTWTPGERKRRGDEPSSVGIQHAAAAKAVGRLAELGHPVPAGWVLAGDHVKRGLVLRPPVDAPLTDVLAWLLGAGEALSTVAVTGRWRAEVFRT